MQQISCISRFYISNFIGNPQLSNFYRYSLMINVAYWVNDLSRAMQFINTSPMVCCSIWGILITSTIQLSAVQKQNTRVPLRAAISGRVNFPVALFIRYIAFGSHLNLSSLSWRLIYKRFLRSASMHILYDDRVIEFAKRN